MNLTIKLSSTNEAFSKGNSRHETARILRQIAERIEKQGADCGPAMDINGNRAGAWEFEEQPDDTCVYCGDDLDFSGDTVEFLRGEDEGRCLTCNPHE